MKWGWVWARIMRLFFLLAAFGFGEMEGMGYEGWDRFYPMFGYMIWGKK
jgi:hypothetical protein